MTTVRRATEADDAVLRRFLRGSGMNRWVEMAIEREPSFFAARDLGGTEWAAIAEDNGDVVGMYHAAVRPAYLHGNPDRVGYLGGLRVASEYRHRIRYLRQGYASIRTLAPVEEAIPWWFTVVAADNRVARRLLEAGIDGLPVYRPLGEYVTYAMPTSRAVRRGLWRQARDGDEQAMMALHRAQSSRLNLSPVLDAALIARVGRDRFFVMERGGALHGVAALWDQRAFKQIVAARYRPPIGTLLPFYNAGARLLRRIPLPPEGRPLDHAFVAFLALSDELQSEGRAVLADLLSHASTPIASVGLHAASPLTGIVGSFNPVRYHAVIYRVAFEAEDATGRLPVQPEAAFL